MIVNLATLSRFAARSIDVDISTIQLQKRKIVHLFKLSDTAVPLADPAPGSTKLGMDAKHVYFKLCNLHNGNA
jgi:hypothetical protein